MKAKKKLILQHIAPLKLQTKMLQFHQELYLKLLPEDIDGKLG